MSLHAELRRQAALRGKHQAHLVVEILENVLLGKQNRDADKHALASIMWIRELLWAMSKRGKADLQKLWEDMEARVELYFSPTS